MLLLLLLLLWRQCAPPSPPAPTPPPLSEAPASPARAEPGGGARPRDASEEVLTEATVRAPERVLAGAAFPVAWTGPANQGDFVTVVAATAPAQASGSYRGVEAGAELELTAPVEPGACEVRYVTGRSHTVLGRAPIEVTAAEATLDAAADVLLGAELSVAWTGPGNRGDFITLVPKETPDEQYGNYTDTSQGSPLTVRAPTVSGAAELRYTTGQGRRVLARRPVRIVVPDVSLDAPDEAVSGATIQVVWTGPGNPGDFVTVVPVGAPDGQHGNYTDARTGAALSLLTPVVAGDVELRYVTGQGHRVLARRPLRLVPPEVDLSAPKETAAGSSVSIAWTGPDHPGDFVTIVPAGTPDGRHEDYQNTSAGSPLRVRAPAAAGDAEVRYMTGQGARVLARRAIRIVP
jgi:Ca-activated chloride channel family protein